MHPTMANANNKTKTYTTNNIVPLKVQLQCYKCKKYVHSSKKYHPNSRFWCSKCGVPKYVAKDYGKTLWYSSKKKDYNYDEDEECRSIVCVKKVEDVKKVEKFEDCFILEFDPYQNTKNLLCDVNSDDLAIVAEKGKVACRDYPHPRYLCGTHHFQTTPHEVHCKMCYCYVCEEPAPCKIWKEGLTGGRHCDAIAGNRRWILVKHIWKKVHEIVEKTIKDTMVNSSRMKQPTQHMGLVNNQGRSTSGCNQGP